MFLLSYDDGMLLTRDEFNSSWFDSVASGSVVVIKFEDGKFYNLNQDPDPDLNGVWTEIQS